MGDLATVLRESWGLVDDRRDRVAERFYARLFLDDPQLRDLFPVHMDVQRERLVGAIVAAVRTFGDRERVDAYLRALGRDHRKYHVRPEHFGRVKTALLEAIRHHAGEDWTGVHEQAWNDVYDFIADRMTAGAADDTDPPYWHAEVLSHERRGPDVAVFTCRPLQPLRFRAGQYLSVECGYRPRLWRTYSVANAPRPAGTLDFHVRDTGGWVSSALVRLLRPGDMLRLAAPMGSMTLDPHSRRDVVFVTGGTGLAPVKAMLDELTRYNRTRWVHLFRGERRGDGFYDRAHLDGIAARYPYLSIVRAASDDPDFPGEHGPISEVVGRHGPWRDHDFYVAGPAPMVQATLHRLAEMGVPATRVRYDAFTGAE
ncbi:globin domain-containing protein [Jidongwangia harbinensis]|uniref:globin domain-containing protein n=1 Tax=Jidongwangia harbinensis TaxID=2878561 RepID=UPI001CD9494E|nr:globin domain-containing protein [Jidongwangia harbinensis]MCA2213987.1 flavohemoprotein [Jidongwangia harbinensis]